MPQHETRASFFLPGLNGIRAIAVLGVVLSHTILGLNKFGLDNTILGTTEMGRPRGIDIAQFGVTMFFALSGFLITTLLLKEKKLSGTVSIKNFYARRILRIWPLYYTYLIVAIVAASFFNISYNISMLPLYIFLMANIPFILSESIPLISHYWSLGVEEQFYLFFPAFTRYSTRRLLKGTLIALIVFMSLKSMSWFLMYKWSYDILYRFFLFSRFQTMMIGVIAAILFEQGHRIVAYLSHRWVYAVAWICILSSVFNRFHIISFLDHEILSVATVIIIYEQIQEKPRLINLENKVLDLIGRISYGIYVTHILVIFLLGRVALLLIPYGVVNYVTVILSVVAISILVAYLSYAYFEKPFLRLKKRFERISGQPIQ